MSDMADKQILRNQLVLLNEAYAHAPYYREEKLKREIRATEDLLKMYEGV